jgi:hypothetical protein
LCDEDWRPSDRKMLEGRVSADVIREKKYKNGNRKKVKE